MAELNIKLTVAYDGTAYHGWANQPGLKTIHGTLVECFSRLFGRKVGICGASRTDAGVHALGQTANICIDTPIPVANMQSAMNSYLPKDIAVTSVEVAPRGFDPINHATGKHYRYTLNTAKVRPVHSINYCWHYPYTLDTDKMDRAGRLMRCTHDFRTFASAKDHRRDSIRTLSRVDVRREGDWIYIDVEGNRFMYNMVRNIAGTLVDIGRGRWVPEDITEMLEARDRRCAGQLAPPQGLCLVKVYY
ncbi:tRNA pseudouridine synthase A [Limihaloglobus sulfuriphilus]|uniref:tRNA pseudouridine synthase A n=1 Tax=Limihaloglobus sulfuriphilus TaxID=1851148 RepID=A0A1Q2MHU0_9BACT|nr:tRNA pseudouridine(38-40) synthase TruA [Limihaloglobus sulfuriphilus]AQQ72219.1 tRNA pseudouridine synthase A [Limihaloglobus sulfuriphilus]